MRISVFMAVLAVMLMAAACAPGPASPRPLYREDFSPPAVSGSLLGPAELLKTPQGEDVLRLTPGSEFLFKLPLPAETSSLRVRFTGLVRPDTVFIVEAKGKESVSRSLSNFNLATWGELTLNLASLKGQDAVVFRLALSEGNLPSEVLLDEVEIVAGAPAGEPFPIWPAALGAGVLAALLAGIIALTRRTADSASLSRLEEAIREAHGAAQELKSLPFVSGGGFKEMAQRLETAADRLDHAVERLDRATEEVHNLGGQVYQVLDKILRVIDRLPQSRQG